MNIIPRNNMDTLHKWMATIVISTTFIWGGLAYYVTTEDKLVELRLTNRMIVVEAQVDSNTELLKELKGLREAINGLRVDIAGGQYED